MTTTLQPEGLGYIYKFDTFYLIFYLEGTRLKYTRYSDPECTQADEDITWMEWNENSQKYINDYAKRIVRPIVGPVPPPPSAVIKKIREMAKRREQHV